MVVEIDEAGNHVLGLLKGSGLVSVDASHFENSEETPCHSGRNSYPERQKCPSPGDNNIHLFTVYLQK